MAIFGTTDPTQQKNDTTSANPNPTQLNNAYASPTGANYTTPQTAAGGTMTSTTPVSGTNLSQGDLAAMGNTPAANSLFSNNDALTQKLTAPAPLQPGQGYSAADVAASQAAASAPSTNSNLPPSTIGQTTLPAGYMTSDQIAARGTQTASNLGLTNAGTVNQGSGLTGNAGTPVVALTPEQTLANTVANNNAQAQYQITNAQNNLQQQQFQTGQSIRGEQSGVDALTSTIAGAGLGGVSSHANNQAALQYASNVNAVITQQQTVIQQAAQQVDSLTSQIQAANAAGNSKLVQSLQDNLDQVKLQSTQAQQKLLDTQNQAAQVAQQAINEQDINNYRTNSNAFDMFNKMLPGSIAGMDPQAVANMMGVSLPQAQSMQALDTQRAALNPSSPDYLLKKAQYDLSEAQAKTVGMTETEKNFQTWQSMPAGAAKDTFANAAGLNNIKTMSDLADLELKKAQVASQWYNITGSINPPNSRLSGLYQTAADGSLHFNIPTGVNVKQAGLPSDQCGGFNNAFYGTQVFGDSLASKVTALNRGKDSSPTVGDSIVMNSSTFPQNGHTQLITAVHADGTLDVADVNADGKGTFRTATIKADNPAIIGFYNPMLDPQMKGQMHDGSDSSTGQVAFTSSGTLGNSLYEDMARQRAMGQLTDADIKAAVPGLYNQQQVLQRATQFKSEMGANGAYGTLPPSDQKLAAGIANYTVDPKVFSARQGSERELLLRAASELNPSFDTSQYVIRAGVKKSFATGADAGNITSLNTAISHLDTLKQAFGQINNTSIPALNSAWNAGATALGSPNAAKINTIVDALSGEIGKIYKGTGSTAESEINSIKSGFDPNASPAQWQATIKTTMDLLGGRIEALRSKYSTAMGQEYPQSFFNSTSLKALKDMGLNPTDYDTAMANPPTQSSPNIDMQAALKAGYSQQEIDDFLKQQ